MEPGLDPIGNHTFIVYVEDRGEPGKGTDRFWVEIRDKNGDIISVISMDPPAPSEAVTIQGGNIVVPQNPK
jgi:hypothetical protein